MEEGCMPQVIWQWLWLREFSNCSVVPSAAFCRNLGVFSFGNVQNMFWQCCYSAIVAVPLSWLLQALQVTAVSMGKGVQPAPSGWPWSLGVHNNSERCSFKTHGGSVCILSKNTCCFSPLFLFCLGFWKKNIFFTIFPLFIFIYGKAYWC